MWIESIDKTIRVEIGQILKELMAKMEEADICHDFFVSLTLGKKAQKLSEKEKREYLGGKKEDHNPKFYEKDLLKVS